MPIVDCQAPSGTRTSAREVAITFDDLPVQPPLPDNRTLSAITRRLLGSVSSHDITSVGFVNEGALFDGGRLNDGRLSLLKEWLDAAQELGNHTYAHSDLNTTPLREFLRDVVRGEKIIGELLRERGMQLRFFRHPYLHTGLDSSTKEAVEQFLKRRGCKSVPVTLYNQDWVFAAVYDRAKACGDTDTARRVSDAYLPYLKRSIAFFERLSIELLGHEVRQILLLHASALNADFFDDIALMLKRKGYRFVSISRVLEDSAFLLPDTFTGPRGRSVIHR